MEKNNTPLALKIHVLISRSEDHGWESYHVEDIGRSCIDVLDRHTSPCLPLGAQASILLVT